MQNEYPQSNSKYRLANHSSRSKWLQACHPIIKLTHLLLVLLVVTIFVASAQAHQAAVTYTLRGYIQNPLYPRPNGSSTISKTFYLTKTPNGYSGVVARWEVLLTPQAGDWESNMALVMGIITPKTSVLDGSGDLQPFAVQGVFNCSDLSGIYACGEVIIRYSGDRSGGYSSGRWRNC